MKKYVLNPKTLVLHIVGQCPHSKGNCSDMISFDTESEAQSYDPRGIRFCKICDRKKEDFLKSIPDSK